MAIPPLILIVSLHQNHLQMAIMSLHQNHQSTLHLDHPLVTVAGAEHNGHLVEVEEVEEVEEEVVVDEDVVGLPEMDSSTHQYLEERKSG